MAHFDEHFARCDGALSSMKRDALDLCRRERRKEALRASDGRSEGRETHVVVLAKQLAKGKRIRLNTRIQKFDLKCSIDDWFGLSNQLIEPLIDH